MSNTTRRACLAVAAVGTMLVTCPAIAGDLDPPAGPVAPTMKTLDQVEPRTPINDITTPGDGDSVFRISQPGSYFLTGNVTGVAAKSGIEVDASDVTIDLRGFTLQGVAGSLDGIVVLTVQSERITILNGTVTEWGATGLDLSNATRGCRVEGVTSSLNTSQGFSIGLGGSVEACNAVENGSDGFAVLGGTTVTQCWSSGNGAAGFRGDGVYDRCTARLSGNIGFTGQLAMDNCAALSNTAAGISGGGAVTNCEISSNTVGFIVSAAATISGCRVSSNQQDGVRVTTATPSTVEIHNCTMTQNGDSGVGFTGTGTAVVTGCVAANNTDHGISLAEGAMISGCTSRNNTMHGITVGSRSVVQDCLVRNNTQDGIRAVDHCSILNCFTSNNAGDGIEVANDCRVIENNCATNGTNPNGAGIHITGEGSRIEANQLHFNIHGLDVDDTDNFIVRNTATASTVVNYIIVANNRVGVIVNAPNSVAINGATGGAGVGSTDPWANFSH